MVCLSPPTGLPQSQYLPNLSWLRAVSVAIQPSEYFLLEYLAKAGEPVPRSKIYDLEKEYEDFLAGPTIDALSAVDLIQAGAPILDGKGINRTQVLTPLGRALLEALPNLEGVIYSKGLLNP